ncbi:MAG: DUF2284 domain-containing protein [Oscillospiraceae bacterium]|nr:DUF2284 domain-containing protein [Oscillospiraceae bacterium]
MLDYDKLFADAEACGFTNWGKLDASTLEFLDDIRVMCTADRCRRYGKTWSCPPACGTLEEIRAKMAPYKEGILVQTVGSLEDEFDYDSMVAAEKAHKEHFDKLLRLLRPLYPNMVPMAAGSCTRCETCTYPDAPCRFPELMAPSMESYGLFVSQVCERNGLRYNYGKNTIAYTSCFLLV